jgi:hypothetical protein
MNSTLVRQYNSLRFRLSDLSNMSGLMNIPNDVWGNLEKVADLLARFCLKAPTLIWIRRQFVLFFGGSILR